MNESDCQPLVSVVIPGYKDSYILETIASVEEQTYPNIEIVVIDDGSPYNLKARLRTLIQQNRIEYIYQENQKMGAAKNNGINNSVGELIAFIDDDDLWAKNKIEKQVKKFQDPEVGLVYTFAEGFEDGKRVAIPNFEIARSGRIYAELFIEDFICNSSVMIRRSCLEKAGLFNPLPDYYGIDDTDLWTRITYYFKADVVSERMTRLRLHRRRFSGNKELMQQRDLVVRKKLIEDLEIPSFATRKYFQRIYFEMGFAKREKDKRDALIYYAKSMLSLPSAKVLSAIFKLPFN